MGLPVFLKGLFVGITLCAPVGPIGILCIRRTLLQGRLAGLLSVLGASTADGVYCMTAALGMTFISRFLDRERIVLELIGAVALMLVGAAIFFTAPPSGAPSRAKGLLGAFSSTFFLMLANPMPIIAFTAVLTVMGAHGGEIDFLFAVAFTSGVFIGACSWSPTLVALVALLQPQIHQGRIGILNRLAGAGLLVIGAFLALRVLASAA